jgi:hypothetical protein
MATICATPFKVPRTRVTKLDACGTVVESSCSTVVSDGIITIEIAREYEDRQDFFQKNADGVFCVKETDAPILKWINLTATMCNVDPRLVNLLAGEEVLDDDAATPNIIGFRVTEGAAANVNAGFEVWTRTAGTSNCGDGQTRYGYMLLPWLVEGTVGDLTLQNGNANFVYTARTQSGSLWGVGPYNVVESAAIASLGEPRPLFDAVGALDHEIWLWTTLQPPTAACGCEALPGTAVAVDSGVLTATLTIPTGFLPAYITWGDTMDETVTVGPTAMHVYGIAGTYRITVAPADRSAAPWEISLAVA